MRKLAAALFVAFCCCFSSGAMAGSFDGKTITYVISTKPGGGYDAYGRLIAKYMQKHLPGSTIIAKNIPGAGHRIGFETIVNSAPDGLTIGTFNSSLIYGQIAGQYGGKIDLSKMSWIGKAASDSRVLLVSAKSGITSIDDLRKLGRPLKIGVNGKGSSGHFESALIGKLLNLELQHVFAFEGDEAALSVFRGELDLAIGSRNSLQNLVDAGEARFILGFGGEKETDVPQLGDVAATSADQALIRLVESQGRYMRVTAGPPGLPEELLKELRVAYLAALTDPELLAEAKQQNLTIAPAGGEELGEVISSSLKQSAQIVDAIKLLLKEE